MPTPEDTNENEETQDSGADAPSNPPVDDGGYDDEDHDASTREGDRDTINDWTPGMVGTCDMCSRQARVEESYRRDDGSCGCPRCGGNFRFYTDEQGADVGPMDLTREWRPGTTGRCNHCGLVARVFADVKRDDDTAACEMCGLGTFEFVYGLPASPYRAPRPRSDFAHEVDGMNLMLRRNMGIPMLADILANLRQGFGVEAIINNETLRDAHASDGFTRHTVREVQRAENNRRWECAEPLLYSDDERDHLGVFNLLRVPFPGRIKVTFAGLRGPIERWVPPSLFDELIAGTRVLVFDGFYKAIASDTVTNEPRFRIAKDFYPNVNALLGRGVIRAWSPTGEEIPVPVLEGRPPTETTGGIAEASDGDAEPPADSDGESTDG